MVEKYNNGIIVKEELPLQDIDEDLIVVAVQDGAKMME